MRVRMEVGSMGNIAAETGEGDVVCRSPPTGEGVVEGLMSAADAIKKWSEAQCRLKELPCPRCGLVKIKRKELLTLKTMGTKYGIFVCALCGAQEEREELPISEWYCAKVEEGEYI